jgi:hypothetical protein
MTKRQNVAWLFFINIHSLLGSSNMYGWVVWAEKVPHRWHGQAGKNGHSGANPAKFCPTKLLLARRRGVARAKNRICSNDLFVSESKFMYKKDKFGDSQSAFVNKNESRVWMTSSLDI